MMPKFSYKVFRIIDGRIDADFSQIVSRMEIKLVSFYEFSNGIGIGLYRHQNYLKVLLNRSYAGSKQMETMTKCAGKILDWLSLTIPVHSNIFIEEVMTHFSSCNALKMVYKTLHYP